MITNKQKTLLRSTWSEITRELSNIDWTNYGQNLLDVCIEESKGHDRFRGSSITRGLSILEEAKYFAIKRLWEYMGGENVPKVEHYLMTQRSCFHAACIMTSDRFADVRRKFISLCGADMKEIAAWDYCDLISDEKVSPGYQLDNRRGFKRSPVAAE